MRNEFFNYYFIIQLQQAAQALQAANLEQFGCLMYESHESSRVNFENSCAELDAVVKIAKKVEVFFSSFVCFSHSTH